MIIIKTSSYIKVSYENYLGNLNQQGSYPMHFTSPEPQTIYSDPVSEKSEDEVKKSFSKNKKKRKRQQVYPKPSI